MKVLFSADWHIKLGQKNVPKKWQLNRFRMFFEELNKINCDLHVIGGDIFDKLPSMEELELYFEFVANTRHRTILFDGNHEATKKGKTFLHNLSEVSDRLCRRDFVILRNSYQYNNIDFIPYTELKTFNPKDYKNKILCTHVRGEIQPHVVPEINLDKLSNWELVFAGDLHSHTNCQRNIIYPGSPMTITFHRKKVKNGVILFDSENLSWEWKELVLPQLLRRTVESEDEMLHTNFDHTIYELQGNMSEISKINRDNSLLDKTLISKPTESKLNFTGKSMEEELDLYLKDVLKIKNTKDYIKVFNDYNKGT